MFPGRLNSSESDKCCDAKVFFAPCQKSLEMVRFLWNSAGRYRVTTRQLALEIGDD
jgi:hypothetical protein